MRTPISPEEAAEALRQVEASRATFRAALGAHRGYQHLWLWGAVWVAQCLACQLVPSRHWIWQVCCAAGVLGSTTIGWVQGRNVRAPVDRRFLAVLATIIVFGIFIWPVLLRTRMPAETSWTYSALVAMQCYIVAGIWFDSYLLAVGVITSVLILAGYWFFPVWFWWWMAVFGGGSLIASGFYVKHAWR